MDKIEIKIPAKAEYVQMIRLATSSLANNLGFNIEEVEDLKVSISEALNSFIPSKEDINIVFEIGNNFVIEVFGKKKEKKDEIEEILRKQILSSLVDNLEIEENKIILSKYKK